MKNLFITIFIFVLACKANGQGVGLGTTTPHPSAMLDISSTNKGLALPRMNETQLFAISQPAKGLLVYLTDANGLFQFNGTNWVRAGGSDGTGLLLPYQHSSSSSNALLSISGTGNLSTLSAGAKGNSTVAIEGTSTGIGGYGIRGNNTGSTGFGVGGTSIDNAAVMGTTTGPGFGIWGNSPTGNALTTNGKIKIGGSLMAPAEGLVLTAIDANGNARWQRSQYEQVAFKMVDPQWQLNTYVSSAIKVSFYRELYDLGNNALPTIAVPTTPQNSTFTVPITGVYAFNFNLYVQQYQGRNCVYAGAEIVVNRGGTIFTIYTAEQHFNPSQNLGFTLRGACQKRLQAGDMVYLTFKQTGEIEPFPVTLLGGFGRTVFSGCLLSAE